MTMDIDRQWLALERWTTPELRQRYLDILGEAARSHNKTWLRKRIIWRLQALAEGDLSERARQRAAELARDADLRLSSPRRQAVPMATPLPKEQAKASSPSLTSKDPRLPPPGSWLTRSYKGHTIQVKVLSQGFQYQDRIFSSLSALAKRNHRQPLQWFLVLPSRPPCQGRPAMNARNKTTVRCAIYTRKSTEEGLEQEFNSLHAQREAGQAYIASQRHAGWIPLAEHYDDGGFSGGSMHRPALQRLLADIAAGKIDCVLVHRVDRLSRSLLDFAKMMEILDKHQVAFVSITQQFNSATSMGRLVLHVLLSFAQFEREIISERTRDKIAAARRKGMWCGGMPVLGYDVDAHGKLLVNEREAEQVRNALCPVRAARFAAPGFTRNGSIGLANQVLADPARGSAWRSAFHQEHAAPTPHQCHLSGQGSLQT